MGKEANGANGMEGMITDAKLKVMLFIYSLPMILLSTSLKVAKVPWSFSRCSVDSKRDS